MGWRDASIQAPLRLAVVCLCAGAFAKLISSESVSVATGEPAFVPAAVGPATMPAGSDRVPERGGWLVQVDGWSIAVDRVGRGYLAALDRDLDVAPEGSVEPNASAYAGLIAKYARAAGLDRRLVAALIAEESGFQPTAESEAGAFGLMQVRPIAARDVGAVEYRRPEDNIRTGVRYLKRLDCLFAAVPEPDRLAFVLAAYNMGPAHVADAQTLARRYGYDPLRWYGSLDAMVPLLEEPAVHSTLPSGYAQGARTVAYVGRVLSRLARSRRDARALAPPAELVRD